jgi:hypothetical protein
MLRPSIVLLTCNALLCVFVSSHGDAADWNSFPHHNNVVSIVSATHDQNEPIPLLLQSQYDFDQFKQSPSSNSLQTSHTVDTISPHRQRTLNALQDLDNEIHHSPSSSMNSDSAETDVVAFDTLAQPLPEHAASYAKSSMPMINSNNNNQEYTEPLNVYVPTAPITSSSSSRFNSVQQQQQQQTPKQQHTAMLAVPVVSAPIDQSEHGLQPHHSLLSKPKQWFHESTGFIKRHMPKFLKGNNSNASSSNNDESYMQQRQAADAVKQRARMKLGNDGRDPAILSMNMGVSATDDGIDRTEQHGFKHWLHKLPHLHLPWSHKLKEPPTVQQQEQQSSFNSQISQQEQMQQQELKRKFDQQQQQQQQSQQQLRTVAPLPQTQQTLNQRSRTNNGAKSVALLPVAVVAAGGAAAAAGSSSESQKENRWSMPQQQQQTTFSTQNTINPLPVPLPIASSFASLSGPEAQLPPVSAINNVQLTALPSVLAASAQEFQVRVQYNAATSVADGGSVLLAHFVDSTQHKLISAAAATVGPGVSSVSSLKLPLNNAGLTSSHQYSVDVYLFTAQQYLAVSQLPIDASNRRSAMVKLLHSPLARDGMTLYVDGSATAQTKQHDLVTGTITPLASAASTTTEQQQTDRSATPAAAQPVKVKNSATAINHSVMTVLVSASAVVLSFVL